MTSMLGTACAPVENGIGGLPATLRVGTLPDQDSNHRTRTYTPLLDYLSETLGISCELVHSNSYEELVAQFGRREIDLAYFGGVSFVLARLRHGAVPIVMRDIDLRFTSYVLVSADSQAEDLTDLEGARFAFGSKVSTSGHLMPRYFLNQEGLEPEDVFASVQYFGTHDAVALAVQDRTVEAGAVNASIVDNMVSAGRLDRNRIRVLWETPAYVDYVWALQPSFGSEAVEKVRAAFFALSKEDVRKAAILSSLEANYYLPASVDDYRYLQSVVEASDLVKVP